MDFKHECAQACPNGPAEFTADIPVRNGSTKRGNAQEDWQRLRSAQFPGTPTRISPGGEYNPKTLTVRMDKQEPIHWPHKEPVLIDSLDLQARHLVVLTSDGKRIQSFQFKFAEDDDARLCIYFDGYQGVQLGSKKNADSCKGKGAALLAIIPLNVFEPGPDGSYLLR